MLSRASHMDSVRERERALSSSYISLEPWNSTSQQIPLPLWLAAASWGPIIDAAKGGPRGGRWHKRLVVPDQPMRNGTRFCDSAEIHNEGRDCALRKGNSYLQRQKIKAKDPYSPGSRVHSSLFENRHDGVTLSNHAREFLSSVLWLFQLEPANVLWKGTIKLLPSIVSKYRSNQAPVLSSRSQREHKAEHEAAESKSTQALGTLQALATYSWT